MHCLIRFAFVMLNEFKLDFVCYKEGASKGSSGNVTKSDGIVNSNNATLKVGKLAAFSIPEKLESC